MKKLFSMLLVLAMLLSCFAMPAVAEDGWATLRVEVFDRNVAGFNLEDCMQLHYVQEKFGDPNHIKVEFVPVSRWDEGEILTTQMSGTTAPDICITYNGNLVNQYIDMGGLKQLDDLLNEYAPNLKAFLGDELLTYGQFDTDEDGVKEQYVIPARRIAVANVGNFIRGDWLAALNMEKPTNIEEFEAYLVAAKNANLGGQMTIPLDFGLFKSDPLINVKRFTDPFIDYSKVTEEDWFAYSLNHEMLPGSKDGYKWLNKLYHEGLINESFAIQDDDTGDRYRVQGYFGLFSQQPDQPWRTDKNFETEMEKNVPGSYWTPVNCLKNVYDNRTLHDVYAPNGLSIIIPGWVSDETAINAIKYLDWMSEYENMFFLQNGTEGKNYLAVNEDGIPIQVQATDTVEDAYKMHAGDVCFISNGLFYGSDEKNAAATAIPFTGYEDLVKESYGYAYTDTWTSVSFSVAIQAETDFGEMVKSKQGEFLVKVVTCAPEEFDAVYDEAIQAILNAGAQDIIDEHRAAYQAGNFRGTFPGAPTAE
ncbi:MAG: extracellular solute-binding protein [Eubacteriales bacterium]|nr:extracellular solute-binding protein [Eubacteriales bacterium]